MARLISGASGMDSTLFVLLILTRIFPSCVIGEKFKRRPILLGDSSLGQLERIWFICGWPNQQNWPSYDTLPGCEGQTRFRPQERRIKDAYGSYVYHGKHLMGTSESWGYITVSERKRAHCWKIAHFGFEESFACQRKNVSCTCSWLKALTRDLSQGYHCTRHLTSSINVVGVISSVFPLNSLNLRMSVQSPTLRIASTYHLASVLFLQHSLALTNFYGKGQGNPGALNFGRGRRHAILRDF